MRQIEVTEKEHQEILRRRLQHEWAKANRPFYRFGLWWFIGWFVTLIAAAIWGWAVGWRLEEHVGTFKAMCIAVGAAAVILTPLYLVIVQQSRYVNRKMS